VIDAELVTDAEYRRLTQPEEQSLGPLLGYRRDVVTAARLVAPGRSPTRARRAR